MALASTEGCPLVASLLTLLSFFFSLASLGLIRENRYNSEIVWFEKWWILFKPLPSDGSSGEVSLKGAVVYTCVPTPGSGSCWGGEREGGRLPG